MPHWKSFKLASNSLSQTFVAFAFDRPGKQNNILILLRLSHSRNKVQTLKSYQTITNRNKANTTKIIKITFQVSHTLIPDGCLMI